MLLPRLNVFRYRAVLTGIMSLLFLEAGCAQATPTEVIGQVTLQPVATSIPVATHPTDISTPTVDKLPVTANVPAEMMIPYSQESIWNRLIGPAPKYDPHSAEMITSLAEEGPLTSNANQFSFPVYFVDDHTPRWDIPCLQHKCTIVINAQNTYYKSTALYGVPLPADAQPSVGSDAQIIVIDKNTYAEYDLYGVQRTPTGWTIKNGSVYNILWNGMPPSYGSRGAGLPYYAGLIRPWEIAQGHIDHALAFSYSKTARKSCIFPASKTDGKTSLPFSLPEGAHLQLDPSLTDADFDAMGLDRTAKIIAHALQDYGMFLIDSAGHTKLYAEDLISNPYATQQWSDPNLNLMEETVSKIPVASLRVLEFPPAYWDSAIESHFFGDCLTVPGVP